MIYSLYREYHYGVDTMRSKLVCELYALRQSIIYKIKSLKESGIIEMQLYKKLIGEG
jgi:hypothetical protein